jgi:hypothetical protein
VLFRDAVPFMPEQHDRAFHRRLQSRKRDCVLGKLHGYDPPAGGTLSLNPAVFAGLDPVDAWSPARTKRVPMRQRVTVMLGIGNCDTSADCVTGPQESAEVRFESNPQRSYDEVVPTAVSTVTARALDLAATGLLGAQRARATALS